MEESILKSIKRLLGITPDNEAFDLDISIHINSVFATLQDLGVISSEGFAIDGDSETWSDALGDDKYWRSVQSYTYLRLRLLFDPPVSGFATTAIERQIEQLEWRLTNRKDGQPEEVTIG